MTLYKVTYGYMHQNGSYRSGTRLVRAESPEQAKLTARTEISKDTDAFKITGIKPWESDAIKDDRQTDIEEKTGKPRK